MDISFLRPVFFKSSKLLVFFALLTSCANYELKPHQDYENLSIAEAVLDEWGSASVSTPIISAVPDYFEFDLGFDEKQASTFYDNARKDVNAGVSNFNQVLSRITASTSLEANPLEAVAYAAKLEQFNEAQAIQTENNTIREDLKKEGFAQCRAVVQERLTAAKLIETAQERIAAEDAALVTYQNCAETYYPGSVTDSPDYPSLSAETNADSNSSGSSSPLSDSFDTTYQNAFSDSQFVVPDITAVKQSFTNHIEASMFRKLTSDIDGLNGQKTYLAISNISTNPGTRTRTNYKSAISIFPSMSYQRASTEMVDRFLMDKLQPSDHQWLVYLYHDYNGVCRLDSCSIWRLKLLSKLKENISENPEDWSDLTDKINLGIEDVTGFWEYNTFKTFYEQLLQDVWTSSFGTRSIYKADINEDLFYKPVTTEDNNSCNYEPIKSDKCWVEVLSAPKYPAMVTAISPLVVGQSQDLSSQYIQQIEYSLALAASLKASGQQEQANIMAEFAKQRRQNFAGRNIDNEINISNYGQDVLGIEIGPSFRATGLERDNDAPSRELVRQTFPLAMLVTVPDSNSASHFLTGIRCYPGTKVIHWKSCSPVVLALTIDFQSTHRWMPTDDSLWSRVTTPVLDKTPRLTSAHLVTLEENLRESCEDNENKSIFITNRCQELHSKLFGDNEPGWRVVPIPDSEPEKPTVTASISSITPANVLLKKTAAGVESTSQRFVFTGSSLKQVSTTLTDVHVISGAHIVKSVTHMDGTLVVDIELKDTNPIILQFKDKLTNTTLAPTTSAGIARINAIPDYATHVEYRLDLSDTGVSLFLPNNELDSEQSASGAQIVQPPLNENQISDLLQSAIEREKPENIVCCTNDVTTNQGDK